MRIDMCIALATLAQPQAHPVAYCCMLLGVLAQSLKPVKLLEAFIEQQDVRSKGGQAVSRQSVEGLPSIHYLNKVNTTYFIIQPLGSVNARRSWILDLRYGIWTPGTGSWIP